MTSTGSLEHPNPTPVEVSALGPGKAAGRKEGGGRKGCNQEERKVGRKTKKTDMEIDSRMYCM